MWWSDREIICKNLKALQILRQVFFCIWAILGGQVGSYSWGRLGHMVRTDRAILMGQVGLTRRTSLPIFDVFSEESGVV